MTEHFGPFSVEHADVTIKIDLSRLSENIDRAQYWLDTQVMTDMVPYMPIITGNFIDRTKATSEAWAGTGKVCAGAPPMGRFLYEGIVMVGETSGSPWAMKGEKKVVTDRPIQYTTTFHPDVQAHWFDATKAAHIQEWTAGVKKIAGGDDNG